MEEVVVIVVVVVSVFLVLLVLLLGLVVWMFDCFVDWLSGCLVVILLLFECFARTSLAPFVLLGIFLPPQM